MNKIKNTCLGLIMFIFAILTGCVPIGGGTTNNNTNVVSGQLSFSTSSLTLATGQSTSITLTLAGSSGVGSTLVSLQESPLQLVNLSPTICSVSTLVPTCTITVTAESQQESTSIIAIASGYTAPQLAVNVSIPLVGWTPTTSTPALNGTASNVGLASDQLGNLYLSYQGESLLNVYNYQFNQATPSWQLVANSLPISASSSYSSLYVSKNFRIYLAYTDESHNAVALSALPSQSQWNNQYTLTNIIPYETSDPGTTCPDDRHIPAHADYVATTLVGSGTQFIAYEDGSVIYSNSVESCISPAYFGLNQLSVGTAGGGYSNIPWKKISPGTAEQTKIASTPNGGSGFPVFVAYQDGANNNSISVMQLLTENGSWNVVGSYGFSGSRADFISIAVDSSGVPYTAFEDAGSSDRLTVMQYKNGNWQNLGSSNISVGKATYISLAINPENNVPYVAYQDSGLGNNIVVQQYSSINNSWNQVGSLLANNPNNNQTYTAMTMLLQAPYTPPYSWQPAIAYQSSSPFQSSGTMSIYYYQP